LETAGELRDLWTTGDGVAFGNGKAGAGAVRHFRERDRPNDATVAASESVKRLDCSAMDCGF